MKRVVPSYFMMNFEPLTAFCRCLRLFTPLGQACCATRNRKKKARALRLNITLRGLRGRIAASGPAFDNLGPCGDSRALLLQQSLDLGTRL